MEGEERIKAEWRKWTKGAGVVFSEGEDLQSSKKTSNETWTRDPMMKKRKAKITDENVEIDNMFIT